MKLELELQVYQDMRRNEYTMTYLQNILNANHFPDEVWKGRGKDAYLSLEKNLQNTLTTCSTRLANSATVLWNALQSYKAAEQTVGTDTLQLNADQIF